jgi:hypothetical protein
MVPRANIPGAENLLGILWRVRVGWDGRPDLQLRHPYADLVVEVNACRRRGCRQPALCCFQPLVDRSPEFYPTGMMLQITIASVSDRVGGLQLPTISLRLSVISLPLSVWLLSVRRSRS